MNWKEFLKPSWSKIVITIVVFFFALIFFFIFFTKPNISWTVYVPSICITGEPGYNLPWEYGARCGSPTPEEQIALFYYNIFFDLVVVGIILLILSYLISCTINYLPKTSSNKEKSVLLIVMVLIIVGVFSFYNSFNPSKSNEIKDCVLLEEDICCIKGHEREEKACMEAMGEWGCKLTKEDCKYNALVDRCEPKNDKETAMNCEKVKNK